MLLGSVWGVAPLGLLCCPAETPSPKQGGRQQEGKAVWQASPLRSRPDGGPAASQDVPTQGAGLSQLCV